MLVLVFNIYLEFEIFACAKLQTDKIKSKPKIIEERMRNMRKQTAGIHHITAFVTNPQDNVDFYAGFLGLRLVKKTINFDAPEVYHLYFGNEAGSPGTVITFFPWPQARSGKVGAGQVGYTTYVVPMGALSFWEERLRKFNMAYERTQQQVGVWRHPCRESHQGLWRSDSLQLAAGEDHACAGAFDGT
jgi:catechol 2,3-dioxygenase-like lactoylglutathione lyase family enzyme